MADREQDHILDALVNHITLPPRLPFRDDLKGGAVEQALAQRLQGQARAFREAVDAEHYGTWSTICRALDQFVSLHSSRSRHLDKGALKTAFNDLSTSNSDFDTLILHIVIQNAGLIIRKEKSSGYIFEAFEVSPRAADVLASESALQWDFPSHAVAIPADTFNDPGFQEHTAKFLEQSSIENVKDFAAVTLKAGSSVFESRDTANPALIGQLLMALLEANGQVHASTITRKRVRDDVCWSDGAENPWRRSPTWLLLRVGILRSLCPLLGGSKGILHYKFFLTCFIARLCEDLSEINPIRIDYLAHARAKLSRRLAKLETKKGTASFELSGNIDEMFSRFGKGFAKTFKIVNDKLTTEWTSIRQRSQKHIFRLPTRADEGSLILSLGNSGQRLQQLCLQPLQYQQSRWSADHASYLTTHSRERNAPDEQDLQVFHCLDLADFESKVGRQSPRFWLSPSEPATHKKCTKLASEIQKYQQKALSVYEYNPEALSLMILTVMELWTSLDSMALQLFPLLLEYETGIPMGILHVLQLSQLSDLRRLQAVEDHLRRRHTSANHALPSIFGDPSESCFAVRYFAQCETMNELFHDITSDGNTTRELKKVEWEAKSVEYEGLLKKAAEKTCLYIIKENRLGETYTVHDYRNCVKHQLEDVAKAIRMEIIEHPLPENQDAARAAVFELLCPRGFAAWRDTTWNIINKLGRETTFESTAPKLLIEDYSGLRRYGTRETNSITLASTTKSFLYTHYKQVGFPIPLDKVCYPNALRLGLYDRKQKTWPARQTTKPSFAHHCTSSLPPKSFFASLASTLRAASDNAGRSANEIIASQTNCPSVLTPFEYCAFQELLLGTKLRWVQLLREIASPNVNFGTLTTVKLVSQLALQAGAPWEDKVLRISHWVFEDNHFCHALVEQIRKRLEAIEANWRETQTLECLVTLAQRLWELGGSTYIIEQAVKLLKDIRAITFVWTRSLRREILTARDGKTAQLRSRDALLAALLFRRTYVLETREQSDRFEPEALACFIECSVIMYDYLPEDRPGRMAKLPLYVRNMFVRDLRLVHCLKSKIHRSISSMSSSVDCAMNRIWPEAAEVPPRVFTPWTVLPPPFEHWVTAQSLATSGTRPQEFHFNIVEGSLLVDHQKLGRLPEEYTNHWFFLELLGDRINFTYPSPLPGMDHMLAAPIEENEVHLGFRDGSAFLRIVRGRRTLELIPPGLFLGSNITDDNDLPMALISKHFHWLDLFSRTLLIRPEASKWRPKESDWVLDIQTGQALRRGKSRLVDVRSPVFQRVVNIFEPFEHRSRIIVFQPPTRALAVHLPNLEISFFVNHRGLLESPQLRAVIDDNQDAGTLYGFDSKIVLSDVNSRRERSVIVAMGPIAIRQSMGHVRATSEHTGFYCRFSINTILNRLDCPPEPRVVYMKAYCHAITSFVLPDPLTGRTGTEEALYNLSCGIAQPWAPVDEEAHRWLLAMAALSPKRTYYPLAMKVQQRAVWLENLAFTAQDDRIYPAVARILTQCTQLYRFNSGPIEQPTADPRGEAHLIRRAISRNDAHRFSSPNPDTKLYSDSLYLPRDRISSSKQSSAFQAATLIRRWSRKIYVTADLAEILQHWPLIQGYQDNDAFKPYLLDELISLDVASQWGSIFNHCQDLSRREDLFGAMFFLATIAFGGVEMTLVRTFIAFTVMKEFQSLSVPKWDSFTQFCKATKPTVSYLIQLMAPAVTPYPNDERSLLGGISMNYKQHRALVAAQNQYEQSTKDTCERLATEMLLQWPCETPSVASGKCQSVDKDVAVLLVRPEWLQLFKNYELWKHLVDVQQILDSCEPPCRIGRREIEWKSMELYPTFAVTGSVPNLQNILQSAQPPESPGGVRNLSAETGLEKRRSADLQARKGGASSMPQDNTSIDLRRIFSSTKDPHLIEMEVSRSELHELQEIVNPFVHNNNPVRHIYGDHLNRSLEALRKIEKAESPDTLSVDRARLSAALSDCQNAVNTRLSSICAKVNQHPSFTWLSRGGLWPCLTPITLLETLGTSFGIKSSDSFKKTVIAYGILITALQRLLRIEAAYFNQAQLRDLFENKGHCVWSPNDYPDWLLLEIENNILIRPDQCIVAKAMISPESGLNSVLQMNMGQGKSSVIIPMIAAVLADRKQLFRVIVPKPLLLQMAQLLQVRLGGLIGRTVKHVPFSRKSSNSRDNIRAYVDIHQESLKAQGIILALPEHLLSFKLSGLQRLSSGQLEDAAFMLQVQSWLLSKSRDVLDECDYSLAVKTQLVYPSGTQRTVDGHPNRWKVVQAVLRLAKGAVEQLQSEFPQSIEITGCGNRGRFPAIYFSQDTVKEALIQRITTSVCRGEGGILPVNDCTNDELETIADVLHKPRFTKEEIPKVSSLFRSRQAARQDVLILRGLLVYRILLMALGKRWNVQYGLHPNRDPVAVPYHAKGVPSDQAEFGHPDVAILLTCLSFYYSGLDEAQFEQVLRQVLKSDDPALDFDRWVQEAKTLPDSMRTWAAINVDDEIQRKELWDYLRYSMVVVDCFLNNFVFPYHAKTFERKIVSSGWDIPSPPLYLSKALEDCSNGRRFPGEDRQMVKVSPLMTTGFSGTNDNRTLLPLTIEQRDLAGLAHTNAEVLTYLLQSRNRHYILSADYRGRRLTEYQFLRLIFKQGIRMLLDAGAQILELDNHDLVKTWLTIDYEAEAAIFFDKEDKARVLYKDGRSQPLVGSHFMDNLGACLVYLDEAHTRGTDLKMPGTARAALTLGPGQTKDHTVQGKSTSPL